MVLQGFNPDRRIRLHGEDVKTLEALARRLVLLLDDLVEQINAMVTNELYTQDEMNTLLSAYVTHVELATTLSNFVDNATLAATLANYVTNTSLGTILSDYVTGAYLTANYTTTAAMNALLAGKQNAHATLTALSGLALAIGDILYVDGAGALNRLPKSTVSYTPLVADSTANKLPTWDTGIPVLSEAGWHTAGWQTALNGTQGVWNGVSRFNRGFTQTGAFGIGLTGVAVPRVGYYWGHYRIYVIGGHAGRIHLYNTHAGNGAFCQFSTHSTDVTLNICALYYCGTVGNYFYTIWNGAYQCYHAIEHTAFNCFYVGP